VGARRNRDSGDFARAIDGQIDDRFIPSASPEGTRGPVMEFEDPNASRVKREYYPDNLSRGAWAHFTTVIPRNGTVAEMKVPIAYRGSAAAVDSLPVMLALKGSAGSGTDRGGIDTSDYISPDSPDGLRLRKLSIALAPATAVEVELVSDFDPAHLLATHFVAQQLAKRWGLSKDQAIDRFRDLVKTGRMDELQGVTRLKLVHAVQRPLRAPLDLSIRPVLVTVATDDLENTTPVPGSWRDLVTNGVPSSMPGGTTCFFVGKSGIDAPSTGTLALDARWDEWGPEMVRHNPSATPRWSCVQSKQVARLFMLDAIDSSVTRRRDSEPDSLELLGPKESPFGLSHSFRDGRARRLTTRLRAASRFAEYYERKGATSDDLRVAGHCEIMAAQQRELWMPCTFRPAAPDVRRITPWFEYENRGKSGDQQFDFARRTSYRVELGRECFRSGEEERLALVFNNAAPTVCDYAGELLKPFASGVTRWGRDPLHDSPVPEANLKPLRFIADHPAAASLKLLAPADPVDGSGGAASPIDVTALPYTLQFDSGTGEFYCDIRLNDIELGKDPYMPFVQLGLATYQPHGLPGLELSIPVGQTIQLLPRRFGHARFRTRGDAYQLELKLNGPSRGGTLLDVTAIQRLEADRVVARWIPQKRSGAIVREVGLAPDASGGWHLQNFRMGYSRRRYHLGLLIEEYEPLVGNDGKAERRVVFGHIIDFGEPAPPFPTSPAAGPALLHEE
jgi:hypothetical protein